MYENIISADYYTCPLGIVSLLMLTIIYTYKASLKSTDHRTDFYGLCKEVAGLGNYTIITIVWHPNKVIDMREWSICEGGRLERFYCVYLYALLAQS